jgi:ubiquinone/menaquinone biosynthesis C-methylase UbiE
MRANAMSRFPMTSPSAASSSPSTIEQCIVDRTSMPPNEPDNLMSPSDTSAHTQFEHRTWSEMHGTYDAHFGRITAQAADALLSAAGVTTGVRLLEVACGTGNISHTATEAGANVIGLDFVDGMVAEARRLHPGIEFRSGDAQDLPFDSETFDAVVCNFGVHHFSEPLDALREAYRVLKSGGLYAFTIWSPPSSVDVNFRQIIREAVDRYADVQDALPPGPPESQFASADNCARTLEGLGFTEVSTREIPLIGTWSRPEQVLDTIYNAMARSKTLIDAQSASAKRSIESAIVDKARQFVQSGTVSIPMPAMLTRARKA